MSKINIYETGWLNMVFEGRNKTYGAYQLRTENPKTTLRALCTALGLFASAAAIPFTISYFSSEEATAAIKKSNTEEIITLVNTDIFKDEPKEESKGPVTSKPLTDEKVIKRVVMKPAEKNKVTEDPATNKELEKGQVGAVTSEGSGTSGNSLETAPKGNTMGTGNSSTTPPAVETTITVDKQPQYPGGIAEFLKNVGKKFNSPAVEDEVKSLKVMVYFVIEKDGSLSNIKVTRDPGYNLGKEALRVLNAMKTKWEPGYKNGEPVRTAYNLPITVNVQ
ncbi:energy transducer TonB [Flavobacterium enshiense]|uniref:energy transducer TonB n=1 Tax=Flavobacterium enshiense TaxID=1341165 RepID=UPI00345DDFB0